MKLLTLIIITFLLGIATIYAADVDSYNANYDVVFDKVIVEINFTLENTADKFTWPIPKDAVAVEVKGHNFEIKEQEGYKELVVNNNQISTINIKYITSSLIEKTKDRLFILDLSKINSNEKSITLKLPERATLKYSLDSPQTSIFPLTDKVITDGKHIIISWNSNDLKKEEALLVIYKIPTRGNSILIILVILIVVSVISLSLFKILQSYPKNKNSTKDTTKNLYEEEKKVVEILLEAKDNELWQKQLEIKSGLTKVKLSRKIKNLVKKEVIEKIPYGNTNKIRLKKD